jgi:thiol:disulfide interchange protein DsbD
MCIRDRYFLGKIKFSHDSDLPYLGVGRFLLSVATFTFVIYLFTGLFGAKLSGISALIPPESNDSFFTSNVPAASVAGTPAPLCGKAKYADKLHLPNGLNGYFDFEQGLACAKEQNKPLFVVFKGHACSNCKKMESTVWEDEEVMRMLSEEYVVVGLYTDDRTRLPEEEQYISELDGDLVDQLGEENLDLQISKYKTNSIPYHVIIKPDGTEIQFGVTFEDEEFRNFIQKGLN